jgi:hypothetical protein
VIELDKSVNLRGLSASDTGAGNPARKLASIFELFVSKAIRSLGRSGAVHARPMDRINANWAHAAKGHASFWREIARFADRFF